jgi:outer membrane protein assembly factor BamB
MQSLLSVAVPFVRIVFMKTISRFLCAGLALAFSTLGVNAGIGVSYVKTLGQANAGGVPMKGTGYRQIAVDADGNLYLAVVRGWPWTSLTKLAPDGRVIWETEFGGYAPIQLTLAEGQIYALSAGANGSQLRRFHAPSGTPDSEWGHAWTAQQPVSDGANRIASASALVAAGAYLFVADTMTNAIRRFDRATAAEKPFATRVEVKTPVGLAVFKKGVLLILTTNAVQAVDLEGQPLPSPRIEGLSGAQAIQVDPGSGHIYVAQGGVPGALINQILQYDASGKPTGVKRGRGGDFNSQWTPDAFAFSSGQADFSLDTQGGLWVNNGLGQLVHFAAGPEFKHDRVLLSLDASSIAVDNQLDVYLGFGQGGMKLSWDNQVLWTSGVRPSGDGQRFPSSPVNGWPVYLGHVGTKAPIFYDLHNGLAYALAPDTGELVGKAGGPGQGSGLSRLTSSGDTLFMGFGAKDNWTVTQGTSETLADWKTWAPFMTPPPELKARLLGVSPDKARVYLHDGQEAICLDTKGTVLWRQPSPGFAGVYVHPIALLGDRLIFLPGSDGKLVARDAGTGAELAVIGNQKVGRRPAIAGFNGLAVATRDGRDYLFVAGNCQIQVFEITAGK